jgi:hypothetical protein
VNVKLNPFKCAFGVPSSKILGFLVLHRGIKANPDKIKAIEEMRPPRRFKDMQRLAGCMAALGRFISRLGEKALPFFKLMKRSGKFEWTPEVAVAFEELKRYLTSPPIMVTPRTREPLLLYLAATPQTARAVLMAEQEEPVTAKKKATSPSPEPPDKGATAPSTPKAAHQENLAEEANFAEEPSLAEATHEANLGEEENPVKPTAKNHEEPAPAT